jgi:hypothetical protein
MDNLFEKHEVHRHSPNVSFLYVLAESNLSSLIRVHPSNQSCFDVEGERYGLPIFAALATGSEEAVRMLLEAQADSQPTTSPFRDLCDQYCRYGDKRINIAGNFAFPQRKGPLTFLAEHGDDILLTLYALSMANIKSTGNDRRTPLSWIAEKGHEAVVRLLLEKGAEPDSKDANGQTPLFYATGNGHEAVARLLLEKGAEPDSKDANGLRLLSILNSHLDVSS